MTRIPTIFEDVFLIKPKIFRDERGSFSEMFVHKDFENLLGKKIKFCQDNLTNSKKGVLRGLHFQLPPFEQSKLVRCVCGKILDVVVDLRTNSKTFGKSFSIELTSENKKQLFVPKGFAHGFQVLSDEAIVNYKVDEYYNSDSDMGIIWNDEDLLIKWNYDIEPILSKKDLNLGSFKNLKSPF